MISLNSITLSFGAFNLLDDINLHITEGDKLALVGKNGAGKTTILKMICGIQSPTKGVISISDNLKIGYLPQVMEHHKGRSVLDEVMTVFSYYDTLEQQLVELNNELAIRTDYESPEYQKIIEKVAHISDVLSYRNGQSDEVEAIKTLKGLGFEQNELSRLCETFSQGWNMRIELAKILLSSPDILLLDEPTNHLDIESIEWLEGYLKTYKGTLVLISHDRKFLDNVTRRTVEVMLGHIYDYKVPYSQYKLLRAERIAQQRAAYDNQQKMIEKTEEFIAKFRYKPTKSNQVQSRIKALDKLDRIEIDEEDLSTLVVKFPPAPRSGDIVYKAVDLSLGYPQKVVFRGANIEIARGEKIALVGRNGEGKTTLCRAIMRELEPLEGTSQIGYNIEIGYYAQNQEDILDKRETVFSTLDNIAVGDIRTKLRDILAAFLFKGEDIDKKVAVLSGGERARLAMAKLMLKPYNLLVLDEPTNHMDIRSKDVLKQALKAYTGTLIVVSHDRDFLDGLVDKVYEFRGGRVKEHLGGIEDFLRARRIENLQEVERAEAADSKASATKVVAEKPAAKKADVVIPTDPGKKFVSKEQRKINQRIDFLEKKIHEAEEKMKAIEVKLAAPGPQDDIMDLTRDYLNYKRDCDAYMAEWETLI